ncbi:amino acid adenylation domain-containing protein [Streptomyces sp. NPDC050560]|uniref:amino acid adenylation domain-containing protein n=1 Tax=Streptomyces sp. NPDC050560 TaxID=3365630 RepID=UPI00378C6F13
MTPPAQQPAGAGTLTGLFTAAVARFADRPAVRDDRRALTYAELDLRSDAFAHTLRAHGVTADDHVGLWLERSVDVFVAILGILKAGAAYVAVDPRYPDARRDLMLTRGGVRLVVARPEWRERLAGLGPAVLPFRSEPVTGARPEPVDHARQGGAASVLFTSGSSGTPKAIVLEHRNIVSFATNPDLPRVLPEDRTGQISSLSFDAFHFEMWTTLAHGAEVAVLPPVPDLLAADFQREMKRRRITALLVPTMVVNHVVREDRDAFAALRILQAGGDVLLPSACRDLLAGKFEGELYNLYGPAEITTACTAQRVTDAEAGLDAVPIGRPLHGVRVHVLDADRRPVAPGETGELYVGGPGVARGYLDAPGLTDESFVPDPFAQEPAKLYRTGDLGRERPDGTLEFRGRADAQVKIRGYRVEPGEVERGLRRHRQVHEAVVLPSGEGSDRHLVAFVVLDGPLPLKELRAHAEAELPDFMVPGHFVTLPEIPASDHGKRDLGQLRELLDKHRERQRGHTAPATETERHLAGVWESLLGAENIGGNDDFFQLGGHSLLALRMQSRVKRDLGVALEYRTVLANPVLSALAAEIDAANGEVDFQ